MKKIDEQTGVQCTCANCTYCQRSMTVEKLSLGKKIKGKRKESWYCTGWEEPCITNVDEPQLECCEHWEIY